MTSYEGTERRRDHRFRLEKVVRYRLVGEEGLATTGWRQARISDVSRRGMRMFTDEPIEAGSRIEIFVLDEDGRPKVSGLVEAVRCVPRPQTDEYFNEYYNPDVLVEYEVSARSPGSSLFGRVSDLA